MLARDGLHGDVRLLLPGRPRPHANLYIHVQRVQEPFETLLAEACQLPPHQVGHVRRRNGKHFGGATLRPPLALDSVENAPREFGLRQALAGLRQPQLFKDVPTARFNRDRLLGAWAVAGLP